MADRPRASRAVGGQPHGRTGGAALARASAGVGLKPSHFDGIHAQPCALDFFEIHAENYLVDGGPMHHHLTRIRERFPLSIHGVGLSIGGDQPLDGAHLAAVSALVRRYEPALFSEHLAWSSHAGVYFNDLLPAPYNQRTLQLVCDHIDQVQECLGRAMLLENPSTYVEFACSSWSEGDFLHEVLRRTGCGLLLDVNNLYVSSINHGRDPLHSLRALPCAAAGQIHLAGFAQDQDAEGAPLLIDTHGAPVAQAVWDLYRQALALTGPLPTLIERDNDVPGLDVLEREALQARALMPTCGPTVPAPAGVVPRHAGGADGGVRPQAALAQSLLVPDSPVPAALHTWNGSDPARRWGVHRNNAIVSLVDALAGTFPVTQQLVGEVFFRAMARQFIRQQPPRSPVLCRYGAGFPDFVSGFAPAASLPYLGSVAALEWSRLQALHAPDAQPLAPHTVAQCLADPGALQDVRWRLAPCLHLFAAPHAAVSLWLAHQAGSSVAIEAVDVQLPESAWVFRSEHDVMVLPTAPGAQALAHALQVGAPLGAAVAQAKADQPDADAAHLLAHLLRHGLVVGIERAHAH